MANFIAANEVQTKHLDVRANTAGVRAELKVKKVTCTIPAGQGTSEVNVASDFFEEGMVILDGRYRITSMTDTFPEALSLDDGSSNVYLTKETGVAAGTEYTINLGGTATGKYGVFRNLAAFSNNDLYAKLDANCGDDPLVFDVIIVYVMCKFSD